MAHARIKSNARRRGSTSTIKLDTFCTIVIPGIYVAALFSTGALFPRINNCVGKNTYDRKISSCLAYLLRARSRCISSERCIKTSRGGANKPCHGYCIDPGKKKKKRKRKSYPPLRNSLNRGITSRNDRIRLIDAPGIGLKYVTDKKIYQRTNVFPLILESCQCCACIYLYIDVIGYFSNNPLCKSSIRQSIKIRITFFT